MAEDFKKRRVELDIPEDWIPTLMQLRTDPDAENDSLEQRLYDLILQRVDEIDSAVYAERDEAEAQARTANPQLGPAFRFNQ